jgi:hypothetical protein
MTEKKANRKLKGELWLSEEQRTERAKVDAWLCNQGAQYTIGELYEVPLLGPRVVPQLIELLKRPLSPWMLTLVSRALFTRRPDASQRRAAGETLLRIVGDHPGEYSWELEHVVFNYLSGNLGPDKVHEIAQMALDPRFGDMRDALTHVLGRIRHKEAVRYLMSLAKDAATAAIAVDELARLRHPDAARLCAEALANPQLDGDSREALRETQNKIRRRVAKKSGLLAHKVTGPVPKALEEWSINLNRAALPKALRGIQRSVAAGFSKTEAAEIRAAADGLTPDEEVRLKFDVKFNAKKQPLWIVVFCGDEDEFEFFVHGSEELIDAVTKAEAKVFKEKFEET